jgi:hypothetical protein
MSFWTCAIVTAISALVSAGFSIAALFGPAAGDNIERYAASRSIALAVAVLCCIVLRSREAIAGLALVMGMVQGFDGFIGLLAHDPANLRPICVRLGQPRRPCVAAAVTRRQQSPCPLKLRRPRTAPLPAATLTVGKAFAQPRRQSPRAPRAREGNRRRSMPLPPRAWRRRAPAPAPCRGA